MMRKLASIVEIASCYPIPDTERLSVARMKGKGWQVVVGRDEFQPGDLCVYFEVDSFLPADDERYAFLRERCLRKFTSGSGNVVCEGIRIKSIKLRGVLSQGLLMPVAAFHEVTDQIVWNEELQKDEFITKDGFHCDVAGSDVTALLKVEHFDEVKERYTGRLESGDALGSFPSAIPKSDEERVQNLSDWFSAMKGRLWQVTLKRDGTSCTIAYSPTIDPEDPRVVCSRNLRLKPPVDDGKASTYWQMEAKYQILKQLEAYHEATLNEVALQGEITGPGINGNRNKEGETTFHVFRAWIIDEQRFMNPMALVEFCKALKVPHVEVVADEFPFFDRLATMDEALKFAEGTTPEGNEREGVVCKTVDDGPFASFKVVSNRYLLKSQD